MSWFDKLFGDEEKSSSTRRNAQKRSHQQASREATKALLPQSNDVYQRPRGKFRFPIDMHDTHSQHDELKQSPRSTVDMPDDKQRHVEKRLSYTLDRKQRRHRKGVGVKTRDKETSSNLQISRSDALSSHYRRPATQYRANGEREQVSKQEVRPTYHRPDFKASEVPSAIFGTKARREIKNSGLKQPLYTQTSQSDTLENHSKSTSHRPDVLRQASQSTKKRSMKSTPNYSKRDNTINIENIYASQIVEEIRREREKKVLQKKRFKASLEQKKAAQQQEEGTTIQRAIDEMHAQQAKQLLGSAYETDDSAYNDTSEVIDAKDQVETMSIDALQDTHQDDYQYEEVDLSQYEVSETSIDDETSKSNITVDSDKSDVEQENNVSLEQQQTSDDAQHVTPSTVNEAFEVQEVEDKTSSEVKEAAIDDEERAEIASEEQLKRPIVAPVLKPTISQHQDVTPSAPKTSETHEHDDIESTETIGVEADEVDVTVAETAESESETSTHKDDVKTKQEEASSTATIAKPIRRHAKPFNVVMTPSDKKRHMEHQQQQRQSNQNATAVETAKPVEQVTQHSSERVASPELVDSTKGQRNEQAHTTATPTKIRRGPSIHLPSIDLLDTPEEYERDESWIAEKKQELNDAFYYFNVPAEVVNVIEGPSVTRFELSVEKGVKVSRITALQDDIKMALAAKDIRIEAPIPGTSLVGIEVPNQNPTKVNLRAIIEAESFKNASSKLTVAMGNRINNEPLLMDIAKTPHALIAGATGSGKSVSINSILISLLYRNHPEELKLLLIDPKMVELAPYNDLPHLVAPVITDVKAATQSLKWAVDEMERRYKLFAQAHVRNITAFNKKVSYDQRMPKIVIVIDELADLMMMAPQEVEQSIARLAQKARACGIHMLIATQRPSVNVITGLIKANIPTRIAFMVSSSVDSRTILDSGGAERLLGYGDMLYLGGGMNKPIRVQGTFVSDEEIDRVVEFIKAQRAPEYLFQEQELLKKTETPAKDELFYEVCEFMVREQSISTSLIQRHFQIGYNRAARMIDQLEQLGYISGTNGSKPRDVYLTESELSEL
ncbi:DNA translocase FtsK [Staphylococcus americanisciuri]|uniref:FtsK/SpoIIIE domain-containing protein n=1 Tax=Staphylococcus americanisciuri TaxID=2973940 RepID=A0ABT2F0G6_9STAP|nr:DNA translocase FtsK [Staphylococcus americanisciuri]MCS4485322.1 FtsK/SpoIIIE domain-containing protein [Staphylococcus americanisciuri]